MLAMSRSLRLLQWSGCGYRVCYVCPTLCSSHEMSVCVRSGLVRSTVTFLSTCRVSDLIADFHIRSFRVLMSFIVCRLDCGVTALVILRGFYCCLRRECDSWKMNFASDDSDSSHASVMTQGGVLLMM